MGKLISYMDFRRGKNDTTSPDALHDGELMEADNIDLSERGGFTTRNGAIKLNPNTFNYEVTQAFEWQVKHESKIVAVINKVVCEIMPDGTKVTKRAITSDRIGYVVMQHKLYFGDGAELYVWENDTVSAVARFVAPDSNLDPIKKCKIFMLHTKSLRVFAAGNPDDPTALYFSEYNDFTYFKELNIVYPTNSEGRITGITQIYGDMLISYNNSWWKWSGLDPSDDATWEALPIPYGCMSHESITVTPFSITFLGREGIYAVSASIVNQDIVMVQSREMLNNVTEGKYEKAIKSIKNPSKTCAVFHDNKYMLAYNDKEDSFKNNRVAVYDWNTNGFVRYTGWDVYSWIPRNDGKLLIASSNYILVTGEGYSDIDTLTGNEKSINVNVKTKPYSLGLDINAKFLQNLYIHFKQYSTKDSSINITLIGDYSKILLNDVDLSESLIWGRSWGKIWGYSDLVQKYTEIKKIASRFQVVFQNNKINDPITVYGLGFEFKPLKPRAARIESEGGLLK